MQRENRPPASRGNRAFFLAATLVLLVDQLSKTWIRANLDVGETAYQLGIFRITNIHNTGAAFGLFPQLSVILTVVAFASVPVIVACALVSNRCLPFLDNLPGKAVLGAILGGTLGNLADRLRFGYVTDFLDFSIWPVFNVADASISVGIIIIAYSILRSSRGEKKADE